MTKSTAYVSTLVAAILVAGCSGLMAPDDVKQAEPAKGGASHTGGKTSLAGGSPSTGGTLTTTSPGGSGGLVNGGQAGTLTTGGSSSVESGGHAGSGGANASGGAAGGAQAGSSAAGTAGAAFGAGMAGRLSDAGTSGIAGSLLSTAGTSGTAGARATGGATTECPSAGGPTMVRMPAGYCIDSTEVTRAQYTAWLNTTTAATINAQDITTCGWNTTFTPTTSCMGSAYAGSHTCVGACDNHPQICVDWCDAVAYCKGVGKRLCGKIGGGSTATDQFANANVSQWHNACSSGGGNKYPYGNTYDKTTCNGYDYGAVKSEWTTTPTASLLGCQATVPYAGVFDLSGNVQEWEDSCALSSDGLSTLCRIRGGHSQSTATTMTCDFDDKNDRTYAGPGTGIRCCWP